MNVDAAEAAPVSLREAAERLGVHYMTAYRYVRLGHLPAEKVGGQWQIQLDDLRNLTDGPPPTEPISLETAAEDLHSALVSGDEVAAWRIVSNVDLEPARIYTELLAPAMVDVGARWACGELTIADEHQATAVATRVIGRLGPSFARAGRKRGKVIVGAPAGDHHSLPSTLFADLIRSHGPEVIDLGAATTPEAFVEVVRRHEARVVVVLSVTASDALDDAADTAKRLREEWPDLCVAIGGRAVTSAQLADELGSSLWAPTPDEAAAAIAASSLHA